MTIKKWLSVPLAVIFVTMLLFGIYLLLFQSQTTASTLKESDSAISLPTPIPANSTRQVTFSAQSGDYIAFDLTPETGFPPMPLSIMGGTVTVGVYSGSQALYSNTVQKTEGTVNLLQTGTYTLQVVNNNDFEVEFLSAPNVDASSLLLHHPYTEYSQVTNTVMQSTGFLLITGSVVAGVAALLVLAVRREV